MAVGSSRLQVTWPRGCIIARAVSLGAECLRGCATDLLMPQILPTLETFRNSLLISHNQRCLHATAFSINHMSTHPPPVNCSATSHPPSFCHHFCYASKDICSVKALSYLHCIRCSKVFFPSVGSFLTASPPPSFISMVKLLQVIFFFRLSLSEDHLIETTSNYDQVFFLFSRPTEIPPMQSSCAAVKEESLDYNDELMTLPPCKTEATETEGFICPYCIAAFLVMEVFLSL